MTSSRSSNLTTLALLLAVTLAVAAPATAVTVGDATVPSEAEAGTQVSASFTLTDLYQEPQWEPWTLEASTELQNVTWTITFIDAQGNEHDTRTYDGQAISESDISSEQDVIELRVELTGEVPAPQEYTYPEEETVLTAELIQTRGAEGSRNPIVTRELHHYTTAPDNQPDAEPGTREARQALDAAQIAIQEANEAGADTSSANRTLQAAASSYQNGNFQNAIELANDAEEEANAARGSRERIQLLMFGGAAVVVLALVGGGGFWWYRQQQDDYDKLG